MGPAQILAITQPESLFSGNDVDSIKTERNRLLWKYHPDTAKDPNLIAQHTQVSQHITMLYDAALVKIRKNVWRMDNVVIVTNSSSRFRFTYLSKCVGDVSMCYHNVSTSLYTIHDPDAGGSYDVFFDNAIAMVTHVHARLTGTSLIHTFGPLMPTLSEYTTVEGSRAIRNARHKSSDVLQTFPLSDILTFYKGKIDPRHVAWILSRCYNLACLFESINVMYGGFTIDGLTVDPKGHAVYPSCGWWYTRPIDQKLIGLPSKVVPRLSPSVIASKLASTAIDLTMIKVLGRTLLGDVTGSKLTMDSNIPKALANWLVEPCAKTAVDEFRLWDEVLVEAFGVRKFVIMDVSKDNLYTAEV